MSHYCGSPCRCLEALTWKSHGQLLVLQIQHEAQGLQKKMPTGFFSSEVLYLPNSTARPCNGQNRNRSRKRGFNARNNQRERAIELLVPIVGGHAHKDGREGLAWAGSPSGQAVGSLKTICRVYFENPISSPLITGYA